MNTIEKLDKLECCGCSSCVQKCPQNAIEMKANEEGFFYPEINKEKCINCGLCVKACPQLKEEKKAEEGFPKAYAMRNKNNEELKDSSSGGIFSIIANYVLENDGVVFGAAYDENLKVNHIKVENKIDLQKLRSSKYVQSNINDTYKKTEIELKKGKKVLFSGTPCQIAGLNAYLMKDYENLITCDLVCHGVPSQKLFEKYLEYLSKKIKSKVVKYNFRSKEKKGWGLLTKVETEDGKISFIEPEFDPYYSNFLEGTIYRESCYNCHYAKLNRISDITLADYWGIQKVHPEFFSNEGNSLIVLNNLKAMKIIGRLNNLEMIETDLNNAIEYNKNLIEPSTRIEKRNNIYNGINDEKVDNYIKEKLRLKTTWKIIIKKMIPLDLRIALKEIKNKM